MDIYTVFTFLLVISLMVMSPGPNGVLLVKTVPVSGQKHGYANVLGIVAAFYLHGTLSVFGLSAIIVSSASLFFAVKVIGAVYLAYLGVKAIMSAFKKSNVLENTTENRPKSSAKKLSSCFFEGLLTNLLNPKVSIFYLAAFPQFINFESDAIASSYILVSVHAMFAALWFSSMVFLIGKSTSFAKSGRMYKLLQSASGAVLLWFSYRVATAK
ncbi:LysE family translocator [Vibrio chagasii]|uniref:LysE family translocator n=1 Tax=Vibrio chagasii TaxID=170679 RepID=UPI002284D54F|nr:LysE family translocator [Vibrio chagasii]MCY9826095.1 LysE family translocator [Vibrio chagasii]